jgi:hypothetical protein
MFTKQELEGLSKEQLLRLIGYLGLSVEPKAKKEDIIDIILDNLEQYAYGVIREIEVEQVSVRVKRIKERNRS